MLYNKLIFLYTSNFCERINDFFCIEDWINKGFCIEYWDLSAITCHEHLANYIVNDLTIRVVRDKNEFVRLVSKNNSGRTLYLSWVNYCWYSAFFYEVLSQYNCKYAFFDNGIIPPLSSNIKTRSLTIKSIFRSLQGRYFQYRSKSKKLRPASYYFKITDSYTGIDKSDENTIIGWCNSGDYEKWSKISVYKSSDYVVFLDQYIPYHNDNTLNGKKLIDADSYFNALNNVFSIIEKQEKVPVIIAAHPAAERYKTHNPFDGRKVVYNKTAELVKNCRFVLAHFTTALSFVVLGNKKLLLLTSDAIKEARPDLDDYTKRLGELLGARMVNMEHDISELTLSLSINSTLYEKYKYTYLTNNISENNNNFENIYKVISR